MSSHVRMEMVVATVERERAGATERATSSLAYLVLTVALAMLTAAVIAHIFFGAAPFGDATGLLVLYGETSAIGVGLAALRRLDVAVHR